VFAGQLCQSLAAGGRQGGGINYAQTINSQALLDDEIQETKGQILEPLVSFIITHQSPALVR
jgi:hypothetical protein